MSSSPALSPLRSAGLTRAGFRHGFFTRGGGVSRGPFASLNTTDATGDRPESVRTNLARIAEFLAVPPDRLFFLTQTHGIKARWVTSADPVDHVTREEGDLVFSRDPGVAVGVRTADCVPVLLAHPASGAVGAIHSGWKGTLQNVAGEGVRWFCEQAGAAEGVVAAVGPHISVDAFEVDAELARALAAQAPGEVVVREVPGKQPHVDLRQIVHAQLARAGVRLMDHVPGCTVSQPDLFFSFRRDGERSGRMLSAVVCQPPGISGARPSLL